MIKRDRLFSDKQCQRVRSAQRLYTPDLSTCALGIFKKDCLTLDHFLVFSGRRPPLRSGHTTVCAYDHICRLLCDETTDQNRCFWKSLLGDNYALVNTLYILVEQIRRSACDIIRSRATARNAAHTKASQRNKAYTSFFFDTT